MTAQLTIVATGLFLMIGPGLLEYGGVAARHARLLGPIVVALAWIALSEATRALRWINLPLGLALLILAMGPGYPRRASVVSALSGFVVAVLAPKATQRRHRLGGGWRAVWRRNGRPASSGAGENQGR